MKILLVRPNSHKKSLTMTELILTEPLELEIIYTYFIEKHEVKIVDLQVEPIKLLYSEIKNWIPDLICFTGYINQVGIIKSHAKKIKIQSPHMKIIVGGVHSSVCPNDFQSRFIDFILKKNQIMAFEAILNNNFCKITFNRAYNKIISSEIKDPIITTPIRVIFEKYKHKFHYLHFNETAILKTAIGCPYSCSFCFCTKVADFQEIPIELVIEEIQSLSSYNIFIVDDNFLFNKTRLEKFYTLIKKNKIEKNFIVYGRADFIANNSEFMKKMKEIGINQVIVGLESLLENELESYNKKLSSNENIKAVKVLQNFGIEVYGLFIANPKWTETEFENLYKSIIKLDLKNITLSILTPFPGTDDYVKFGNNLKIKKTDYYKWDFTYLPCEPKMSVFKFYYTVNRILTKVNLNFHNLTKILLNRPLLLFSLFKVSINIWLKVFKESFFSKNIWDFWAKYYDNLWAQKYSLKPTQEMIYYIMSKFKLKGHHLDLGCGTGKLIHENTIKNIDSVGLDRSFEMVNNFNIKTNHKYSNLISNGNSLPFKKESFDFVTMIHSLPYMYPKRAVFEEIYKVLKSNGILIVTNANSDTIWDHLFITFIKMTTLKGKYLSQNSIKYYAKKSGFKFIESNKVTKFPMPSINAMVFVKGDKNENSLN